MLRPAIKLEVMAAAGDHTRIPAPIKDRFANAVDWDQPGRSSALRIAMAVASVISGLARESGMPVNSIVVRELEEPGHAAVAYSWQRRHASKVLGQIAWRLVSGEVDDVDTAIEEVRSALAIPPGPDDVPEMISDADRTVPTIGITGTNGKTTTTRLIAAIMRNAGFKVGWTSSAGVVINEEMVLPGDYTGPSGAARVFAEPDIDFAVLETARGGILLRGIGYEHNDVSVMTNISADHMGLHGVHSLEALTEVKAVVARITVPDGFAVLNADDPRVLAVRDVIVSRPFLFSRSDGNEAVDSHIEAGGWAVVARDGEITWYHDGSRQALVALEQVPITFGGRAQHMVENALAATAACLAIGMPADTVAAGLREFRNRADQNRGRLNVYTMNQATVVIDFAHNEAGLESLLTFGRSFCRDGGRLLAVIGTAGDRDDDAITGVGRLAADLADGVIIKDTDKYLRGRSTGEMPALQRAVVGGRLLAETAGEYEGFLVGMDLLTPGDVLAVMCIEDYDTILPYLEQHATALS